jgi:site-specific DNA-cytosine methylase
MQANQRQSLDCLPDAFPDRDKLTLRAVAHVPKRGDVDMIAGGPPCQGFSGLNSNRSGQNSKEKVDK